MFQKADKAHLAKQRSGKGASSSTRYLRVKPTQMHSKVEQQKSQADQQETIGRIGCVAKNKLRHKNAENYFGSGGNLEEIRHESNLPANVAFPNSFNLALSDDVHCLVPAEGPPRSIEAAESESGVDSTFDESVVLLDDIIEVFALS